METRQISREATRVAGLAELRPGAWVYFSTADGTRESVVVQARSGAKFFLPSGPKEKGNFDLLTTVGAENMTFFMTTFESHDVHVAGDPEDRNRVQGNLPGKLAFFKDGIFILARKLAIQGRPEAGHSQVAISIDDFTIRDDREEQEFQTGFLFSQWVITGWDGASQIPLVNTLVPPPDAT